MNSNEKQVVAKTLVWWDINSCPVPDGYDACLVGRSIESALKKSGYSGPLTITAIGNVKHTLQRTPHVLPAISSTGILLNHCPGVFGNIFEELLRWTWENRPPATLMLITGDKEVKHLSRCLSTLKASGYTILRAYPQQASYLATPKDSSSLLTSKKCLWESLLKDAIDSGETRRPELQEKLCETGESPCRFFCSRCKVAGQSFEDFTTHLKSRDHALRELSTMVDRPPPKRKLVKPVFNLSNFINKQTKDWRIEEDRRSL